MKVLYKLTCTISIILFLRGLFSLLCNCYDESLGFLHRPTERVDYVISLPAHGAVIGAWFGAWPMPLDWERPWQVLFILIIILVVWAPRTFLPHLTIPFFPSIVESSNGLSRLPFLVLTIVFGSKQTTTKSNYLSRVKVVL